MSKAPSLPYDRIVRALQRDEWVICSLDISAVALSAS